MPKTNPKLPKLPESVNELIADRAIRHAVYLERYKSQVVNELLAQFNSKLEPALRAKIERSLRRLTLKSPKIRLFYQQNKDIIREQYKIMEAKLYDQLSDFSKVESAWLIKTMEAVSPVAIDFVSPNATMLKALARGQLMKGALLKDWFGRLSSDTAFAVNGAITEGMIQGEGIDAIVRRIKGTRAAKYRDGILEAKRSHLRSVVRTGVSNVSHTARQMTYESNSDVVKAVEIIATLDTRTCLECMNLDGNVFPIGEGRRPPFHFSCRCTDAPVLKSWRELGLDKDELTPSMRASMSGQVPATQTYPAWLKKQSVEIQNDALGIERAKMFRSGKLKLRQFIDRRNKPLTLKQLESLN